MGGTAKIKVNPTQVRQEMDRPVPVEIGTRLGTDPLFLSKLAFVPCDWFMMWLGLAALLPACLSLLSELEPPVFVIRIFAGLGKNFDSDLGWIWLIMTSIMLSVVLEFDSLSSVHAMSCH